MNTGRRCSWCPAIWSAAATSTARAANPSPVRPTAYVRPASITARSRRRTAVCCWRRTTSCRNRRAPRRFKQEMLPREAVRRLGLPEPACGYSAIFGYLRLSSVAAIELIFIRRTAAGGLAFRRLKLKRDHGLRIDQHQDRLVEFVLGLNQDG